MSPRARLTVAVDDLAISRMEAFVDAFATEHGLCADDRARSCIVLEELICNLRKYGYAGRSSPGLAEIALSLETGPRLVVELVDEGRAFDPFAQPPPDLDRPPETWREGGVGLPIVRALTEGTHYRRVEGRNVTQLTLNVELSDTP